MPTSRAAMTLAPGEPLTCGSLHVCPFVRPFTTTEDGAGRMLGA